MIYFQIFTTFRYKSLKNSDVTKESRRRLYTGFSLDPVCVSHPSRVRGLKPVTLGKHVGHLRRILRGCVD